MNTYNCCRRLWHYKWHRRATRLSKGLSHPKEVYWEAYLKAGCTELAQGCLIWHFQHCGIKIYKGFQLPE